MLPFEKVYLSKLELAEYRNFVRLYVSTKKFLRSNLSTWMRLDAICCCNRLKIATMDGIQKTKNLSYRTFVVHTHVQLTHKS